MRSRAPSQTSVIVAVDRALHQAVDGRPLILDDPIAPLMVGLESRAYAEGLAVSALEKPRRSMAVVRARYAEDCLAESVARGAGQYLILGAGLDTFAYRQPPWAARLRIFEVDHPASQTLKRARLAACGLTIPANLEFVPVDFEAQSLDDGLRPSGFDFAEPTFCAWLGVTMYLTDEAIDATLKTLVRLPTGSEVALQVVLPLDAMPPELVQSRRGVMARFAALGEPWISFYRPEAMIAKARGLGFSQAIELTTEEANRRYCAGRDDRLAMPRGTQLMRLIV